MKPVVFNQCAGWLHGESGRTGVILCNPYGHEALWTHRSWRRLADQLSAAGMPTLRFDYRGTGDSIGTEQDGDELARWLESTRDAIRYLKETAGVERIALCGMRLGATVAALVADGADDVDALILMAPVQSGREYIRELNFMQRRWLNSSPAHVNGHVADATYVETIGFRMYAPTVAHLGTIALPKKLTRPVSDVLLFDPAPSREKNKLLAFYREAGSVAETVPFDDYAHMISDTAETAMPQATLDHVVAWLHQRFDTSALPAATTAVLASCASVAALVTPPVMRGDGFIETPVSFDNGRLFGVYCRPDTMGAAVDVEDAMSMMGEEVDAAALATGQYAMLFTNTASSHHIGESRMWVTHARRLARAGVASLRMDTHQLGDSAQPLGQVSPEDLHSPVVCEDVSKGVDWLYDAGHTQPAVMGICSGAYLSLHASVMNPRVVATMLINQRAYVWNGTLDAASFVVAPTSVYLQAARHGDKWRRLFKGQIPVGPIVKTLAKRGIDQWSRQAGHIMKRLRRQESSKSQIRNAFAALHQRGVDVRIIYGEFDHGVAESVSYFGRQLKWLQRFSNVSVIAERTLDHALFLYPARELMMKEVDRLLFKQVWGVESVRRVSRSRAGSTHGIEPADRAQSRSAARSAPMGASRISVPVAVATEAA